MFARGMAAKVVVLSIMLTSIMMPQCVSGMVVRNSQTNRFASMQNMVGRDEWRDMQGAPVNFMSVLEPKSEQLFDMPNLLMLAGQLGLNSLVVDVVKVGLTNALSVKGPLTVLGPKDDAFSTVPDWMKADLDNSTKLIHILEFHVLKGKIAFADIKDELTVKTLLGKILRFNVYPSNVVTAQCATLDTTNSDKMASNGVLQELNQVIIPSGGNIIQASSASSSFGTLVSALKTAGLDDVLSGQGPFTLFAPTESAFKKLDPQTWQNLLNNKTALTDLLEYHVTNKTYCSAGLGFFTNLVMLNSEKVNITVSEETLEINNAAIIPQGVDCSVSNGVVHAIDTVLIPPTLQPDLLPLSSLQSDQ